MGEALRTYRAALHALEVIVAYGCGCLEAGGDIGVVNDLALLSAVRPYACEAVRLKFEIDGERVSLGGILTGKVLNFLFDSENILHVVPEFVGDNVGLREVRIAAAEAAEFIPEAEVDVDLPVGGAVKRAGLGLGHAAAGLRVVAKEHKLCGLILSPCLLRQELFPGFLHIIERP